MYMYNYVLSNLSADYAYARDLRRLDDPKTECVPDAASFSNIILCLSQ